MVASKIEHASPVVGCANKEYCRPAQDESEMSWSAGTGLVTLESCDSPLRGDGAEGVEYSIVMG